MRKDYVAEHAYQRQPVKDNDDRASPVLQSEQGDTEANAENNHRDQHPSQSALRSARGEHFAQTQSKPTENVEQRYDRNTHGPGHR